MESRGPELVDRYRENYGILEGAGVTETMILRHWDLERKLTQELLESSPEKRREVFERCYTLLYREISWLNRLMDGSDRRTDRERFADWLDVIGDEPLSIYEIGSGRGELITLLASRGHDCVATEITVERGERDTSDDATLVWHETDGVKLTEFEKPDSYDLVLSNQLIEHLHPDDLDLHLKEVHTILKPGGRYVLNTPHRYTGPHDLSRVFGHRTASGMHLREYTYRELFRALTRQGFVAIRHAGQKRRLQGVLRSRDGAGFTFRIAQSALTGLLLLSEGMLACLPYGLRVSGARISHAAGVFSDNLFLEAWKRQ